MSSRSLPAGTFGAGIEVLREERAEIEFVERIGLRAFPVLSRFPSSETLRRCSCLAPPRHPSATSSSTGLAMIS